MILQKQLSDLKVSITRGDIWEDTSGALHLVISNDALLANAPFVFTLRVVKSGVATRIVPYSLMRVEKCTFVRHHSSLASYEVETCVQEFMMYISGFTTFNNVDYYDAIIDRNLSLQETSKVGYEDPNPVFPDPLQEYISKARERVESYMNQYSQYGNTYPQPYSNYQVSPEYRKMIDDNHKAFLDSLAKSTWPTNYKKDTEKNKLSQQKSDISQVIPKPPTSLKLKDDEFVKAFTDPDLYPDIKSDVSVSPIDQDIMTILSEPIEATKPSSTVKESDPAVKDKPKHTTKTPVEKSNAKELADKLTDLAAKKKEDIDEQQLSLNLEQPAKETETTPATEVKDVAEDAPKSEETKPEEAKVVIDTAEDIINKVEGFDNLVAMFVNKEINKAKLKALVGVTSDKVLDDAAIMEMSNIHPWRYGQANGNLFVKGSKRDPYANRRWVNLNDKQRDIIVKSFADYDELRIKEGANVLGLSYDEIMEIISAPKRIPNKPPKKITNEYEKLIGNNINRDWKAFIEDFKEYDSDTKKRVAKLIDSLKTSVLSSYFSVPASTIYSWRTKYRTLL